MANFFQEALSNLGRAVGAPVIFDNDTQAARDDVAAGNGKRAVDSAAYATVNKGKEYSRAGGKIYNYAGDIIGTYTPEPTPNGDPGGVNANSPGAGGAGGKIGDAATIGAYEQQIADLERSLGLLPGQLEAGLNQLNDGLNKGKSRLNEQQSLALTRSAAQRGDTKADFQDSLVDTDSQTRGNYQAMMALLGRAGAGSSSAASVVTPYAVSNEASKTRGKVADTYGRNVRDLDLADDETKLSYENNVKDLEEQRRTQEYNLRQGVESTKAKTLGAIAEAQGNRELAKGSNWATAKSAMGSTLNQKNEIEAALSTMLNSYRNPYTVKDVAIKTAKLDNYAVDPNGVKIEDPNGPGKETDTAALTAAQIKEQEELKKKTV